MQHRALKHTTDGIKDEVCEMKVKGARGRQKRAKQADAAD